MRGILGKQQYNIVTPLASKKARGSNRSTYTLVNLAQNMGGASEINRTRKPHPESVTNLDFRNKLSGSDRIERKQL